jgi:hypothetical protein
MAIVQVSQITNRLGLNADLPQLAGGELGWSTDTRQLYIGNGTLAQGAPVIGNTEILTEFSDILNLSASYTYKGTAAGYTVQTGPTPGTPVTISLQNWLDQFASVLDFGAVGDGLTDNTAAINRALNQLYCQQSNPQIRRALFFPAGVYRISAPINIPSYATLYGEGPDNSIIQMIDTGGTGTCVAQTADSLQQTDSNIGNSGATPPIDININNMAFQSLDNTKNIFLVQSATDCKFSGVSFIGPGATSTLTVDTLDTAGVVIASLALNTVDIAFNGCRFTGTVYGVNTSDSSKGVSVTNSNFNILYQGVALGTGTIINGGPTGTRIATNTFDNIYSTGIAIGPVSLNASGYNIFYDVADHFQGVSNPHGSIIIIQGDNNVSIGDMFARSDIFSVNYPRISLSDTISIATTNGSQIQLGSKTVQSGHVVSLPGNVPAISPAVAFTFNTTNTSSSFKIDYSILLNLTNYRTGVIFVSGNPTLNYTDDYTENTNLGINLTVQQSGSVVTVYYSSISTDTAQMSYSISYFN